MDSISISGPAMNIEHVKQRVRIIHIGQQHGNPTMPELVHLLYRDVLTAIADGHFQGSKLAREALMAEMDRSDSGVPSTGA